jgi:large subunit ribosomal protein L9
MKVILQESYMSLGEAGDVINVKPGYARNFLIPNKLAVSATAGNLRLFADKAKEIALKKEKERENSKKTLGSLEKVELVLKRKVSEEGKLFGSITTKELEAEFAKLGVKVDRRQIVMGRQIKMMGDYSILVKLVGGLKTNVPLKILSETPLKSQLRAEAEAADNAKAAAAQAERNAATEVKDSKKAAKKAKKSDSTSEEN